MNRASLVMSMKSGIALVGALALAGNVFADPRNLGTDLADKKNILKYVALPEGYNQKLAAYVKHADAVWLNYGEGDDKKSWVGHVNDASYITSVSTQKVADIVIAAEHYSSNDGLFEKILEEYGIPDKEINTILLHEALNKVAVLPDPSLHAELLLGNSAYLVIINVPNGSSYVDGKYVLSEEDKRANEVVQQLKEQFKTVYGLR